MPRIVLLDDWQEVARRFADWSRLPAEAELTVFHDHLVEEEALAARLLPFEIVGVMRERTPVTASLLARLPNLRLLVTTGMSNASVDVAVAVRLGVTVCGTPSPGQGTAELTLALMLSLARHLETEHRAMREGGWQTTIGRDLEGTTLGLLGLGRLGARVAGYGRALGMTTIAWSQNLTAERAAEVGVRLVDKDTLFREADYLSIHLRLSERSRGLVGARELALMRPDAALINTSRGPIVDQAAILAALDAGRPGAAALDVYDQEPLPEAHPFRRHPRLLLTPHIGYVTEKTYRAYYGGTLEAILAWLEGRKHNVIGAPGGG